MSDEKTSLSRISLSTKEDFKIPKDAEVTKKDVSIRVEEIENGYILSKSYDIEYQIGDSSSYKYYTKQWYTKENPLEDSLDEIEEATSLADKFE